jgi:hypothetical protein
MEYQSTEEKIDETGEKRGEKGGIVVGFRVRSSGFRIRSFEFRVSGFGFRVSG